MAFQFGAGAVISSALLPEGLREAFNPIFSTK
jgi:hypothetical protein